MDNIDAGSSEEKNNFISSVNEKIHTELKIKTMPSIRKFSYVDKNLFLNWYNTVVTKENWSPDPEQENNEGVEGGFWVKNPPEKGYAKPRLVNRRKSYNPVAAVEKIASDLAYLLDYPVPPNILYERKTPPENEEFLHCISLCPFKEIFSFGFIKKSPCFQDKEIKDLIKYRSTEVMSAMMVFDTWLQCYDHAGHYDNLLISIEDDLTCNFAYIDYAYSMLINWGNNSFDNMNSIKIYDSDIIPDNNIVNQSIDKIKNITNDNIDFIVNRIPDIFLDDDQKRTVSQGLKFRRDNLERILKLDSVGEKQ